MKIQLRIASILFAFIIIFFTGQTVFYNLPLWNELHDITTYHENPKQVSGEVYQFLTDLTNNDPADITGFTANENSHMQDVKDVVRWLQVALYFSLLGWLYICLKTKQWCNVTLRGSAIAAIALLAFLVIPFDTLFIWFHKVFFPQGNWMFSEGVMIEVYTGPFFVWLAQIWWIKAFVVSLIFMAMSFVCQLKKN